MTFDQIPYWTLIGSSAMAAVIGACAAPIGTWLTNRQLHKQRKDHIVFENQLKAMQDLMARLADWNKRCPDIIGIYLHIHENIKEKKIENELTFLKQHSIYLPTNIYDLALDIILAELDYHEIEKCSFFLKEKRSDSVSYEAIDELNDANEFYRGRVHIKIIELKNLIKKEINAK